MISNNLASYHLIHRFQKRISAENAAHQIAFRQWHPTSPLQMSWAEVGETVEKISLALLSVNIEIQENVGIFANNSMAWSLADLAILQNRGVTVPLYGTNSMEQAAYIINDAKIRILFVGDQEQYHVAKSLLTYCPNLQQIIVFDEEAEIVDCEQALTLSAFMQQASIALSHLLTSRIAAHQLDDLFTIIYTSGTTGEPKGVMLDYRNIASTLYLHDERLSLTQHDVSLCFLPLSHVFERAWSFYVMHVGAVNVYLTDTNALRQAMSEVRPTVMCAVPRVYEKMYRAIFDKVAKVSFVRRTLFQWAIAQGKKRVNVIQSKRILTISEKFCYRVADRLVLRQLRQLLGGRVRFLPVAGARLDDNVMRFFLSIGLNMKYGYGMTETCATVSCWEDNHYRLGSIGTPLSGVGVRIGDENEIQVKGPIVMRGYYNKPSETSAAFTADGWLKTGDVGALDAQGHLFITERLKDLMKTSNGKYIAPQMIEGLLGQDKFIEHIAVIADARNFVSALIVPCFESLEEYAHKMNVKYHDRLDLLRDSQIVTLFEQRLKELQKNFAHFHQVKRFTLLPLGFSMEKGELTPTLKLRRKVIAERYQSEIESMYS